MSSEVDDAVLALLKADAAALKADDPKVILGVYDAYVTDSDDKAKTISAPLPYLVFYPTPGRPVNVRASGVSSREYEFQVSYVGKSREQAVWAQEEAERALDGVSITVAGKPRQITRTDDNQYVGRDDTWTRPDGGPLFYGALRFTV